MTNNDLLSRTLVFSRIALIKLPSMHEEITTIPLFFAKLFDLVSSASSIKCPGLKLASVLTIWVVTPQFTEKLVSNRK